MNCILFFQGSAMVLLQYKVTPYWRQKLAPITLFFNLLAIIAAATGSAAVLMLNFWLGQVTEAINYLLAQIDQMDDTSNSFGDFFVRHHQFIFTIAFAGFTAYQILFCKIPFDMANPKRRSRYGPLWSTSLVICVVSGALVLLFNLTLAVYIGFFFLDNLRANLEFGMGTAVKFHFKYYKGPMNNQPAKISRHTSKLQQIQFRFKCCGDWRGWETYKHLRTFESAPYDDSYIFVDKLPSCCRIDPSPPLADCLHDVGNPTDDLEPEDPKLVYHWNDLFYTTGCPWVITERYENYVMALVGLLGFMSFIKLVELCCCQYLYSSLITAHKIYRETPVPPDDFAESPGYLLHIPYLGEPPLLEEYMQDEEGDGED